MIFAESNQSCRRVVIGRRKSGAGGLGGGWKGGGDRQQMEICCWALGVGGETFQVTFFGVTFLLVGLLGLPVSMEGLLLLLLQ